VLAAARYWGAATTKLTFVAEDLKRIVRDRAKFWEDWGEGDVAIFTNGSCYASIGFALPHQKGLSGLSVQRFLGAY
jgi:hypothetical protein